MDFLLFFLFHTWFNLDQELWDMKKEMIVGCTLIFYLNGVGQVYHQLPSYGLHTTGAYSLRYTNAFSFSDNPACLGTVNHWLFGALTANYWLLEGLNHYAFAASFPMAGSGAGMIFQQSGDELFKEQGLEGAYGKHLGKTDIGMVFDYLRDQAAGYGSVQFFSAGLGLRYRVTEKLLAGWAFGLPFSGNSGKPNSEKSPQYFRMGFGYQVENDLLLSLQIEKQSGQPADFFGNIEYRYGDHFIFSAGIHGATGSLIFKSGWKKNHLCIQLCVVYEPVLGISPGLMLLGEAKNTAE